MAITITAKIVKAYTDDKGVARIEVEFDDKKGVWTKHYNYSQAGPIDLAKFQEQVTADIKKDLKVVDQLTNIKAQIGKTFTITI